MTPRLVSLAEAQAYLGGRHPHFLGITPVMRGVYDLRAIDAALDLRSGLAPKLSDPTCPPQMAANDVAHDELTDLEKRIADASRRA